MTTQNPSVLIVGAGPTGLVLALTLVKNGIMPRIIQKDLDWRIGQKGTGIQPRTLDIYRFLDLHRDITHASDTTPPMRHHEYGKTTPSAVRIHMSEFTPITPDRPDTNSRSLGQDKHEAIIRAHLEKYGCFVEKGIELKTFVERDDGVNVELHKHKTETDRAREGGSTSAEIEIEKARYDWVVGCDGGSSVVRKQLGLNFLGETNETGIALIGDIEVLGGIDRDFWHRWGSSTTKLATLRASEDPNSNVFYFIVGGQGIHPGDSSTWTRERFIELFQETTGCTQIEFGKLLAVGTFRPVARMVDTCRKGHVFVAGDAFHCHPPTGGQGLNSCVLDVVNLGWKLSLVIKGLASETLLDTYGEERIPVIATMLSKTSALMKDVMKAETENASWTRGTELRQMGVTYRGSSILVDESPSATPDEVVDPYRSGGLEGIIRAGDRAPDAPGILSLQGLDARNLFRLFNATRHVVLVFDLDPVGRVQADVADVVKKYSGAGANIVTAMIIPDEAPFDPTKEESALDYVLEDHQGYACKHYKLETPELRIVVVRPDGVVGAVAKDADGLGRYFRGIFSV